MPLYFFVIPLTVRLTTPWLTRIWSFSYARKRSISSPPLAAFRSRRLSRMMSNNGLNSNEAREERTATNSSVMLSGIRREKEAPVDFDIDDHSTEGRKSEGGDGSRRTEDRGPRSEVRNCGESPEHAFRGR